MQILSNQSVFKVIPGTAAEWSTAIFSQDSANAKYMPPNVVLFETDTRKMKISDAVATTYAALQYVVDAVFESTLKAIIDDANTANGVLVLNDSGIIDGQYVPAYLATTPAVVANIAARDAIPEADRNNIVLVRNATADPTVGISPTNAATRLLLHFDGTVKDSSTYENVPLAAPGSKFFSTTDYKFGTASLSATGNVFEAYHITPIPAASAFVTEFMYQRPVETAISASPGFIVALYYENESAGGYQVARLSIAANSHTLSLTGLSPTAGPINDTINVNDGLWHRVAIRHTGTTIYLYVDDRLVGSAPHVYIYDINLVSIGSMISTSTGTPGTYKGHLSVAMTGNMDEFRIVNYDKMASDTTIPTAPFAVNDNAASYIWDDVSSDWVKISEYESMDVDFSGFVKQGDEITRLSDGATYKRFTVTERTQLAQLITDLTALSGVESLNYTDISGRFDSIEDRQTAIGTRLVAIETGVADLETHAILDTDTVTWMSQGVSKFM